MKPIEPLCVWPVQAELGEGPLWVADEGAVYFVDIKCRHVHRLALATGEQQTWDAPAQPGFIVAASDRAFVCGLKGGLHRFDPRDGTFTKLLEVERERPGNRLNDGFVDAKGRLWFGSMDDAERARSGRLYRLDASGALAAADDGYVVTNGPATSPDGRTLYHTDTFARTIYAFDLHDDGTLTGKRVFAVISRGGYPDGMAVDEEGCVWVALFGGGRIERLGADGRLVATIAFPCDNVTKLAFGGDDLRTVYATTACKGLTPDARARQPLAGGLFAFRSPSAGLSAATFNVPTFA
ncbi:SMP-30/gluconolactonase/LRE family protein [Trinickia sp. LjRoot230]|uniref:SMP-30/gluconolactonase/LRE family protein n=1 Tax=Trinickia sp. LjRoot230 TaxID=3342288 RepID=UPI003ED0ED78